MTHLFKTFLGIGIIILRVQGYLVAAEHYGLVVGVTGYPHFLPDDRLKFADKDAEDFAALLLRIGFLPNNIHLLTNANATHSKIYEALLSIAAVSNNEDIVYIFFAGHGSLDNSSRAYLMPYDANPNNPAALGIRADRFLEDIKDNVSARLTLFFIDACHAAAALNSYGSARGPESITPSLNTDWQREFKDLQDLKIGFLAASANQRSWESDELKHGVFAYYLLKGFGGEADLDHDGLLTAGELRRYLQDNVEHYSKNGVLQSPTVTPTFEPGIALVRYTLANRQNTSAERIETRPPTPTQVPAKPASAPLTAQNQHLNVRASAKYLGKVKRTERYRFAMWIEGSPPAALNTIQNVEYEFLHDTNPLSDDTDDATHRFVTEYEGWGCYRSVRLTVHYKSTPSIPVTKMFDMCQLLGW